MVAVLVAEWENSSLQLGYLLRGKPHLRVLQLYFWRMPLSAFGTTTTAVCTLTSGRISLAFWATTTGGFNAHHLDM